MITLKNVVLRRGTKVLLDSASTVLNPGEKAGLVGRNGAGKSSLFALLTNRLGNDRGEVEVPKHWRRSEVAQDMPETEDGATDFVLQGDGLAGAEGRYDLILCNPPYVNSASMAALPAEYRAEPELALAGGTDGMDFIRELLRAAPAALNDDGVLVLEIGNEREHFEAAFPQLEVVWMDTSSGADQVLLVTKENLL